MNLHEYQKGRGHSLTFAKGHSVFKLKFFFLKTKYHVKDLGSTKMKIYANGLGHMVTLEPPCLYIYMINTLQKSSPPELVG